MAQGRIRWIDRVFDIEIPVDIHPELLERVRGTPARLEERIALLSPALLRRREEGKWSIQEHAGHLFDVDLLFLGRLDDYETGLPTLRPADMTGRKTFEADYNAREIESVLKSFRDQRIRYVERLQGWGPQEFGRTALHPRLGKPMRVCDMLYFQAEHDDYHLARIGEMIRAAGEGR